MTKRLVKTIFTSTNVIKINVWDIAEVESLIYLKSLTCEKSDQVCRIRRNQRDPSPVPQYGRYPWTWRAWHFLRTLPKEASKTPE